MTACVTGGVADTVSPASSGDKGLSFRVLVLVRVDRESPVRILDERGPLAPMRHVYKLDPSDMSMSRGDVVLRFGLGLLGCRLLVTGGTGTGPGPDTGNGNGNGPGNRSGVVTLNTQNGFSIDRRRRR